MSRGVHRHTVFQSSLIAALVDGVYAGDMTVAELLEHGDLGLGTFDSLDGEMIVVDSICYRLGEGGEVTRASGDELVPFAVVTEFDPDISFESNNRTGRSDLVASLAAELPSSNYLYAARISGEFEYVTMRNVTRQDRPYRPLAEVTDGEPVHQVRDVAGVMVGFQTPAYERGIGVPGGHLHFVDDARTVGGHVLDFAATRVRVEVCVGTDLVIRLPTTTDFERADLDPADLDAQVASSENHD